MEVLALPSTFAGCLLDMGGLVECTEMGDIIGWGGSVGGESGGLECFG